MKKLLISFLGALPIAAIAAILSGELYVQVYMYINEISTRSALENDYGLAFEWVLLVGVTAILVFVVSLITIYRYQVKHSTKFKE